MTQTGAAFGGCTSGPPSRAASACRGLEAAELADRGQRSPADGVVRVFQQAADDRCPPDAARQPGEVHHHRPPAGGGLLAVPLQRPPDRGGVGRPGPLHAQQQRPGAQPHLGGGGRRSRRVDRAAAGRRRRAARAPPTRRPAPAGWPRRGRARGRPWTAPPPEAVRRQLRRWPRRSSRAGESPAARRRTTTVRRADPLASSIAASYAARRGANNPHRWEPARGARSPAGVRPQKRPGVGISPRPFQRADHMMTNLYVFVATIRCRRRLDEWECPFDELSCRPAAVQFAASQLSRTWQEL